jgi:hypothetical protein
MQPLRSDFAEILILSDPNLGEKVAHDIRTHAGFFLIEYAAARDRISQLTEFASKIMISLLRSGGCLGYTCVTSQVFRTTAWAIDTLEGEELRSVTLFKLLTNVHFVKENSSCWMHTHGLDQFGVPDLEMRFGDEIEYNEQYRVLANAARYMIERGPILKPGDTIRLTEDGKIYRIVSSRQDRNHPFGALGSIKIQAE